MIVLGIESSCDETAVAIVNDEKQIMGEALLSQAEHKAFGGVVPEIAARSHLEHIDGILEQCLNQANIKLSDVDAIAAASGPGLIGGVMVGVMSAKALSIALNKPYIAVNHLEGHALAARVSNDVTFPYLLLLVSGGHCQILVVKDVGEYERLGTTIDDAVGEAFDKVAKMLGLGYPGGPAIEKLSASGDENRFTLPKPLIANPDCNLSFSGLKTAVRKIDCLCRKLERAISYFKKNYPEGKNLVVSGGVASNTYLRKKLQILAEKHNLTFAAPPIRFCTDNGVMVAWAGLERFRKGYTDSLDFKPRPRWPLDMYAPKVAGAGGVKA